MSDSVQFVEFFGERFAVPARMNARLKTRFFALAAEGGEGAEVDASKQSEAAILLEKMVQQSVRPEDRKRFDDLCDREMPSDEELMQFLVDVMSAAAERPTGRPSDSSDGQTSTAPKSATELASSDAPKLTLVQELEAAGRADKAEFVVMAERARSAS